VVPRDWAGGDGPVREQLSALRSLLVLSMILTRQDDQAGILHLVANAVPSLGHCELERIFLDGGWTEVRLPDHDPSGPDIADGISAQEGVRFELTGVPWSWAYSMSSPRGPSGYLVVGAKQEPTESERFLLQVLAQQAGIALANARLHAREREQSEKLRIANLTLRRTMEIHDRLTQVALEGDGQEGIAQAVHELTGYPAAIEDRFGNLRAWAGPGRPDPYPKDTPRHRDSLLRRAVRAGGPVRDGKRLYSVALLGGAPVGALVLHDPDEAAMAAERVAIEHATTVLAMEFARLQTLAETEARLRSDLVVELIDGAQGPRALNLAQALGYDLGRPHRVVVVEGRRRDDDVDAFLRAVGRATREVSVGSLLAARLSDVVLLADREVPWERFRAAVVAELRGADCRIGVGGRRGTLEEFPQSYREAQLALKLQKVVGGREHITLFDDLGVYQVLATAQNSASLERFVQERLGTLMEYDAVHGTQLVTTLSEYLECGGNYDASAKVLSVHRSTLKYRLRRIREVTGYDLALPDTQFNLQLAARAWRTAQALRDPLAAPGRACPVRTVRWTGRDGAPRSRLADAGATPAQRNEARRDPHGTRPARICPSTGRAAAADCFRRWYREPGSSRSAGSWCAGGRRPGQGRRTSGGDEEADGR
jgi:sugar diacid utilization regulator